MQRVFKNLVKEKNTELIFDFVKSLDYQDCMDVLDDAYSLSSDRDFREKVRTHKIYLSFSADIDAVREESSVEGAKHFIKMIEDNNLKAVNKLIKKGYATIRVPNKVLNPIFMAIKEQNLPILTMLIEHCHYNINELYFVQNERLVSLMEFALWFFEPEILKYLLNSGLYPGQRIHGFYLTGLGLCCSKLHNVQMAEILITHGVDVDRADKIGNSPLHWAVVNRNFKMIKLLLEYGANPWICNFYGLKPVDLASKKAHIRILRSFMKKYNYDRGIRYNIDWVYRYITPEYPKSLLMTCYDYINKNGNFTYLSDTASLEYIERAYKYHVIERIVKRLIARKRFCETNILMVAVYLHIQNFELPDIEDNEETTQILIEGFHGWDSGNLMIRCVDYGYFDTFKQIFQWNVFARAYGAVDSFVRACTVGKTKFVRYILESGLVVLDIEEDKRKEIVIHVCTMGYLDILKILIAHGYDIHFLDKDNISPLYVSVLADRTHVVSYLMSRGANDVRCN